MARRQPVTVCPKPGCPELRPCPVEGHEPKAWAGSTRKRRLPSNWSSVIVPRILKRDPICRACMAAPSTEVDHAIDPDDHSDESLQGLCTRCHAEKTKAEASAGRRRARG